MKLGFCGHVDLASEVKEWGYDYIELPLAPIAQLSQNEFEDALKKLNQSGLPCLACNVFLPGSISVVGPNANQGICAQYAEKALSRAAALGAKIVVFGSAGSRNIPACFSYQRALVQIRDFAILAADAAKKYDITVLMEPLNSTESNVINKVSEAMMMAMAVNHPHFKVLADTYHMEIEKESLFALKIAGSELRHVHVSTLLGRKIPLISDKELLTSLFAMLHSINYEGNISVEAGFRKDQASEAKECLSLMRSLL